MTSNPDPHNVNPSLLKLGLMVIVLSPVIAVGLLIWYVKNWWNDE